MYFIEVSYRCEEIIEIVPNPIWETAVIRDCLAWLTDKLPEKVTDEEIKLAKISRRTLDLTRPQAVLTIRNLMGARDLEKLWRLGKYE